MTHTIIRVPTTSLKPCNLREDIGDPAELDRLGDSLLKGQDYPLLIGPDGEVYDGNRRLAAALRKAIQELDAIRLHTKPTPDQVVEIFLRTSVHRRGISDFEKFKAVKLVAETHKDWSKKRLAEHLDLDQPDVTRLLSEGCPAVEEAFRNGVIGLAARYELSKLAVEEQPAFLTAKRHEITAAVRKRKAPTRPAVKVGRVRCALPGGVQLTIAGAGLDFETAIQAAQDAARVMRKARDEGLSVKAFQLAQSCKASVGGAT